MVEEVMKATTCATGGDSIGVIAIESGDDSSDSSPRSPNKEFVDSSCYSDDDEGEERPSLQFAMTMPSLRAIERSQPMREQSELLQEQAPEQTQAPLCPKPRQEIIRSSSAAALELDWTCLKEGKLYGRDVEIEELQKAFYRRLDEEDEDEYGTRTKNNNKSPTIRPELVLVSGKSGTGKSCLVTKALQQLTVEENDGHFVMGKFDQLQTVPVPYGPFVAALTQLVIVLEQTHFQNLEDMRERIVSSVGLDGCRVLCCLVPALSRFLGLHQQGPNNSNNNSSHALSAQQERLKVALHKFFHTICSSSEPLVFVLDDLQWADSGSLSLLETLVSESIIGLVVVGVCRSNEVPWHHTFAGMLRRLEDDKGARIVHIQVKNLPVEATNGLLVDMLRQPPAICQPLAHVIHTKSEGNVLFILQILKTMFAEKVLIAERIENWQQSSSGHQQPYQWLWHEEPWQNSFASLDIIDLISCQIKRLPESCQRLLKTAACIGAEFDSCTLAKVLGNDTTDDIRENLAIALEEQMIVQQLHRPGKYAFLHDRIQQAGYALIPEEEQGMSHLSIGRALLQAFNETELEDNLFLVVNQLIRGMSLLTSEVDKNGLAGFCLRAGQKASRASDYETARQYFCTGTELLSNRHWRDEYHLSVELFNCRAEAESACGDFDAMESCLDEALANCRSSKDELAFHLTRMCSLGSRSMFRAARDLGFRVMESLGERFPSKPRLIYLVADLVKIKRRLRGKSDSDILSLPSMDIANKSKLAVMKVLKMLCLYLFVADQDYYPFAVLRMVKLTLKYGLCDVAAYAFAGYGLLLCAIGEFDEGYRYGKLSMQLLEQDQSIGSDLGPKVNFVFHAVISPWKKALRSTFDGHRATIVSAMELCDHECFVYSSYSFAMQLYLGGEQLGQLEDELNQYIEIITLHKQDSWLGLARVLQMVLRNLQGKTDNPLELDFSSNGTEVQQNCNKFDVELIQSTLQAHRLLLSYYLGDLDGALAAAKILRRFEKSCKSTYFIIHMYFFDGMASLEAAHHSKRRHHLGQAKSYLKKLENLSKHSEENVLHHVYLLRGEVQAVKGNLASAMDWYKKAIDCASSQSFVQIEALAHERAGIAYERLGAESNSSEAKRYLRRAIELYEKWGAAAVVAHVKSKHGL